MSQIVLVRLNKPQWSYGAALAHSRHCRLDPSSNQHAACVDEQGVLQYFHFDTASRATRKLLSFQLQLRSPERDAQPEPIRQPWFFEFVPGLPGEIMLVQSGSCRILYASLPRQGTNASDVFLFGSHTARVTCITTNGNIALSGCCEGTLRLWRMADGQLADTAVADRVGAAVTAIECLGPLMAAAGTATGSITIYDTASGRLLTVQRLLAGTGPVSCLAAWINPQLLSEAAMSPPGPRVPDGGGVLPGPNVGAPWRGLGMAAAAVQQEDGAGGSSAAPTAALLAAAGTSGWLRVYQASLPGPHSWRMLHSSSAGSLAGPITAIGFSPAGNTLAVAGPAAQVLGTDATAIAAAGGQPGAVSLYCIESSSSSAASPAGQQLQLWHQWCLRSLPISMVVLPSSGVQLMTGRQLGAMQVLNLLVTPELGSSLVLTASRQLDSNSSGTQQQLQQQQQQKQRGNSTAGASHSPLRQLLQPQQLQCTGSAAASPDRPGLTALGAAQQALQQQQQQSPAAAGEVAAATSAAADDVLNIAGRDLSAIAQAIAAADSLQESDLEALLDSLVAEATAALEDQVIGEAAADAAAGVADTGAATEGGQGQQQEAAEAAAGRGGGDRDADADAARGLPWEEGQEQPQFWQQEQQQQGAPAHTAAVQWHLFGGSGETETAQGTGSGAESAAFGAGAGAGAAAASTSSSSPGIGVVEPEAGGAAGGDAASWFRKPTTLPTLRSWMDRAAVLSAGTAAEGPTALNLDALAEEMQQAVQQQQQQEVVPEAAQAAIAVRYAPQEQEQPQEEKQQQGLRDSDAADELELPCESTFQELKQQQLGEQQQAQEQMGIAAAAASSPTSSSSSSSAPPSVAQYQVQQHGASAAAAAAAAAAADGDDDGVYGGVDNVDDEVLGSFAGFSAAAEPSSAIHAAAAAAAKPAEVAAADSDEESEPRPRQLPAALQRPLSAADRAVTGPPLPPPPLQQQQQGAAAAGIARLAGLGRLGLPQPARRPPAAWTPAAVHVTPAGAAAGGVWQQKEEEEQEQPTVPQEEVRHEPKQQQQQQQQRVQLRQLGVRERLSLRRAQVQQQQEKENVRNGSGAAAAQHGQVPGGVDGAAAAAAAAMLPVSDHPLASAVMNSSRLLERKIQEAQQPPQVRIEPSTPAAMKLAVQLAETDVAPEQQQYHSLPDLKDIPTPTHARKLLPKQLDARWVASRSLKPQQDTLFKPQEWQPGSVAPQVLLLPSWPTPQQVVQQLLWPTILRDAQE